VPTVDGIEFNPPHRSFLWLEGVHREDFRLRAASRLNGRQARGQLSVFFGTVLLAEVSLSIRVDAGAPSEDRPSERATDSGRPYRRIFASYSHRDLDVVEQFAMFVQATGDEFVRDWTHLRAGEQWSDRLIDMIREADIFELFWSTNSMRSPFVRDEWTYALGLRRPNFVRPVYWEDPLPAIPEQNLPPAELQSLHFQRLDFGAPAGPVVSPPREIQLAPAHPTEYLPTAVPSSPPEPPPTGLTGSGSPEIPAPPIPVGARPEAPVYSSPGPYAAPQPGRRAAHPAAGGLWLIAILLILGGVLIGALSGQLWLIPLGIGLGAVVVLAFGLRFARAR
jgi:hypothetical protein